MASTIKVDNVQNQPGTNIVSKCGTDVTIGASGDTVALASGASQTGFGRTGTVDWDTSIKTGTVTAVTGSGYFVNTTSGEITVNLPAAAVGSIVAVSDYASTADSNNIIIAPNGSEKINGVNANYTISTAGLAVTLVYADATRGWKSVTGSDADAVGLVPAYITATGGNQPTPGGCIVCTNYKQHTFTGPGTFCVSAGAGPLAVADYLVIAGGGGGGWDASGGGGAGGYRFSDGTASGCYTAGPAPLGASALAVSATPYPITVGGGGAAITTSTGGNPGDSSTFSTITSAGGGAGGRGPEPGPFNAVSGGSGGGAKSGTTAGSGNTPPVSPPQGNDGGTGPGSGGGGGGAGAVGSAGVPAPGIGGDGGAGLTSCITATPVARGGGGGGGNDYPGGATSGGSGGGGAGGTRPSTAAAGSGTVNTGGGGGGASVPGTCGSGAGGSGVVIIRYKFQ
jgi:hypothetical protein